MLVIFFFKMFKGFIKVLLWFCECYGFSVFCGFVFLSGKSSFLGKTLLFKGTIRNSEDLLVFVVLP